MRINRIWKGINIEAGKLNVSISFVKWEPLMTSKYFFADKVIRFWRFGYFHIMYSNTNFETY